MGFTTSLSAELLRLAKNGYMNTMDGTKLDKKILGEEKKEK